MIDDTETPTEDEDGPEPELENEIDFQDDTELVSDSEDQDSEDADSEDAEADPAEAEAKGGPAYVAGTSAAESDPAATLPLVAIVGRPNVGKSTLLNRIIGRREAIVEEKPGVTRDRLEFEADWVDHRFRLVDTGGWLSRGSDLDAKVSAQSEAAMAEATAVLFVVDGQTGLTDDDAQMARLLRRADVPVLLVVNKCDAEIHQAGIWEFSPLGLGEPFGVSAVHGVGTGDMLDTLVSYLPEADQKAYEAAEAKAAERGTGGTRGDGVFSVALVGRPNVGKSTLFNRLIGEERAVTHDLAGTTRDSIDTVVETEHGPIRFVDTAGMRRKAKIDVQTEYYSFVRALRSVDDSDVACLVIDATIGVTAQDLRLAERVDASGCPIVILLNKWELVPANDRPELLWRLKEKLHFLGDAPVLKISALTGKGVHTLLPTLATALNQYHRRIPTSKVNQVLRQAQQETPAPKGAKVLYATQGGVDPPTFTLFANKAIHATYVRYLERRLREAFDLGQTPIKMRVRKKD